MCEARCSFTLVVYSHSGQHSSLGPALLLRALFLLGKASSWSFFLLVADPGLDNEEGDNDVSMPSCPGLGDTPGYSRSGEAKDSRGCLLQEQGARRGSLIAEEVERGRDGSLLLGTLGSIQTGLGILDEGSIPGCSCMGQRCEDGEGACQDDGEVLLGERTPT